MNEPLTISFQGAARTVTGSRHLIRLGSRRLLFDCGLFQGRRDEAERVNRAFAFEPEALDAVVISHAHLDHIGNLPTMAARGYSGVIHATPATADLSTVMLPDAAFLMAKDVEHVNRHRKPGTPEREPLYAMADVERVIERMKTHAYGERFEPIPGASVEFHDAGHILGSAFAVLEFRSGEQTFRLGMSGDVGRPGRPILRDPEAMPGVDALVMECTYGDRLHPSADEAVKGLAAVITRTLARGGRVLIPAFAVGRSQELVVTLHGLMERREIREVPIFVDSPLAWKATQAFRRHPECFDAETHHALDAEDGASLGFDRLHYTVTVEQSQALNQRRGPCIVIAASGMCEGGRILHHLQHGLANEKNTVLFVGFQAQHTLGRRLRDGQSPVRVFGEPIVPRAEIAAQDGFSAHADQRELIEWVARIPTPPRTIYLVHGEIEPAETLAELLRRRFGATVRIPQPGEEFPLWN